MSLKFSQGPEWSAWICEQAAEDTLSKTRQYNADADVWRLLRPEDLSVASLPSGGVTEKHYYQSVSLPAATSTAIITFRVPAGIGITFMGFWITTHLGEGAVYELDVNGVKRQQAPIRGMKAQQFAFDDSGHIPDFHNDTDTRGYMYVHAILLEQFVFTRQNDKVDIKLFVKYAFTGQVEFFPIAVVAGNRKQLLVAE